MKKIAIHSVPRSGSTWLGEIFNSHPQVVYKYQPLFSYKFKGKISPTSKSEEIDCFFNEIANSDDEFLNQYEARLSGKLPNFKKSPVKEYVVYKEVRYHHVLRNMLKEIKDVKVIGLIRNPLATLYSWLNAPREFRSDLGWNELEEWRLATKKNENRPEEFNGFEKWKEVAFLFHELQENYPDNFKIVFYEDLLRNTKVIVEELFKFCELTPHENVLSFIHSSSGVQNHDAYSVFKTKKSDDKWKGKMHPQIESQIISEIKGTSLEKYILNAI